MISSLPERTYGYSRSGILAALANAVVLDGVSVWALRKERFRYPQPIASGPGLLVALVGLDVNAAGILSRGLREFTEEPAVRDQHVSVPIDGTKERLTNFRDSATDGDVTRRSAPVGSSAQSLHLRGRGRDLQLKWRLPCVTNCFPRRA